MRLLAPLLSLATGWSGPEVRVISVRGKPMLSVRSIAVGSASTRQQRACERNKEKGGNGRALLELMWRTLTDMNPQRANELKLANLQKQEADGAEEEPTVRIQWGAQTKTMKRRAKKTSMTRVPGNLVRS